MTDREHKGETCRNGGLPRMDASGPRNRRFLAALFTAHGTELGKLEFGGGK
jgi:hypothetical protein